MSRRQGRQRNYGKQARNVLAARDRLRATEARQSRERFGRRATTTRKGSN